jgi:hypothetical protein
MLGTACFHSAAAEETTQSVVTDTLTKAGEAKLGFGKGSFIVAPIPLKNPTLGNGLILAGGYLFKLDEKSSTSFIGAAAMKTGNGSYGLGAALNLSFGQGRWAFQALGGRADLNYTIASVGSLSFKPVPLTQSGDFVKVKAAYGITEKFFLGIDAQYLDTTIQRNGSRTINLPNFLGYGVRAQEILFGPTFTWDARDDTIYPTAGTYGSLTLQRGTGLGGNSLEFNRGVAIGKGFVPLGERTVLAVNATACSASDTAPFFNMCAVGVTDALRGYSAGSYIDNALLSAQGEIRQRLSARWGAVAFAGVSVVGPDLGNLGQSGGPKVAGGVGVRFRLSKDFPLDFSVDQTINREGQSYTYVYIGQDF